jgi:hypothetical protein
MELKPYTPRPIRFLGLMESGGVRLKVYGIGYGRERPREELVEAGKRWAERRLRERPTRQVGYGVGFLGIHDGRGETQVFLDQWVNENELLHAYAVSNSESPGALREAGEDHNSVCVWDLAVQCFERVAWMKHVLANPRGMDLEAYLGERMNADV